MGSSDANPPPDFVGVELMANPPGNPMQLPAALHSGVQFFISNPGKTVPDAPASAVKKKRGTFTWPLRGCSNRTPRSSPARHPAGDLEPALLGRTTLKLALGTTTAPPREERESTEQVNEEGGQGGWKWLETRRPNRG